MLTDLTKRLKRASAMAGLAATLAFSGQASAVQFVGAWDPAFGTPFTNLGWRGEATFDIPSACLSLSGNVWNSDSCSSGGMKILSASVEFYRLSPLSGTLETLSFDVPSTTVFSMTVEDGMLSGVNGLFPYFRHSNLALAGYSDFQLSFWDQRYVNIPFWNYPAAEDPYAQLFFINRQCSQATYYCLTAGVSAVQPNDGPFMTFRLAEVPEPGSLALMLPALGLLAFARRRKSSIA